MLNTKTSELNDQQTARAQMQVVQAADAFKASFEKKHGRQPTTAEYETAITGIKESILKSVVKSSPATDAAKRDSAQKAVNELAALHGIKFTHNRELEEVVADTAVSHICDHGYTEHNRIDFAKATRGGSTIAFKYALGENNDLFIEYSVAFCRADENFDPLIGKQEALKKFLAGDVIAAQITHEPFGPVKLDQLTSLYKAYEVAGKETNK